MKTSKIIFRRGVMLVALTSLAFSACGGGDSLGGDMVTWYRQPGEAWLDGLPVGNGIIGGMVFGKTDVERIALNETTFWSGRPQDRDVADAGSHFEYIKEQIFAGNYIEMDSYINQNFYGRPNSEQAYQPLGDLMLHFPKVGGEVENYRRELDMETGVTTVTYTSGGVTYRREVFVSYPDKVMVVRVTSDKAGALDMQAELKSVFTRNVSATPGRLTLEGVWTRPDAPPNQLSGLIAQMDGEGMSFQTVIEARVDGGESATSGDRLDITGANSVTLLLSAATSYVNYKDISGNPAAKNDAVMAAARTKDYKALKEAHIDDFSALMSRVHLTVGDSAMNAIPTDERLAAMRAGGDDPNLEALIFQFGRYTLAAASRVGGQASNLQGIWNEEFLPPWGSKWTTNINVEMNYWMAEVTNLAETTQPLFDLIEEASIPGAKTAKVYYGIDEGWVVHHNLDVWKSTAPVDAARYGMWPVGGAWMTRHIWEHYEYNPDIEFARKYYPLLKGSAQFLSNLLVHHPPTGWLVTPFSMSPEHGFMYGSIDTAGETEAWVSPGPTMDIAIIRDLFPHVIEWAGLLGVDADFSARLADQLTKLPPYRINSRGTVMEWIYDFGSGPEGHNMSTHYGFFPGNSTLLHRASDREIVAGHAKFLEGRASGGGWPSRWDLAMWARLERGDMVAKFITDYSKTVAKNLYSSNRYNQIDGTAGNTGGIAEALIQSHAGEISLLPALPTSWPDGSVTGLRARGDYEVNMSWAGGRITSAEITGKRGGTIAVRAAGNVQDITLEPGKVTRLTF